MPAQLVLCRIAVPTTPAQAGSWSIPITHHEVRSGGKNSDTGGRGIFAPTADRVVSWLPNTDRPLYLSNHLHFWSMTVLGSSKLIHSSRRWTSVHWTKPVVMVTAQHLLVTWKWYPSSRARQTLRIFHVGKLHSNQSFILIQESFWIPIHFCFVKQFKTKSSDIF